MLRWLNPRIVLLVLTLMVLLSVTRAAQPQEQVRRAIIACSLFFLAYVWAFVWPLRNAVDRSSVAGMTASLFAGWVSVAFALVADALPLTPDQQVEHSANWPRMAFIVAAIIAFYLFFDKTVRGFDALAEMKATGRRPD